MKKLTIVLCVAFLAVFIGGCVESPNNNGNTQVVVNATEAIGDHLNLQALGELIKSSKNPQEIEQKLNQPDGINNLDLDGDGKTDYLSVTEYGDGATHGYSVCAELADGKQEVANVQINTQNSTMVVNGNQNYYGANNCYQSSFSTADMFLLAYLMQPRHIYYASPYHYGYYGYGYRPYVTVPRSAYYSRPYVHTATTKTTYRTVTTHTTTVKSPNANAVSKQATTRSLSSPTRSQKSFSTEARTKPVNASGFKSNNSYKSNSSSYKSSSGSRSSYGSSRSSSGSRSSFGSSRSSSSRSSSSRSGSRR